MHNYSKNLGPHPEEKKRIDEALANSDISIEEKHQIFDALFLRFSAMYFHEIQDMSEESQKIFLDLLPVNDEPHNLPVPFVENLDIKIYEAVTEYPALFCMGVWHWKFNPCGTQHCWAGWAIHIAGPQAYAIEKQECSPFAALCVMKKANPDMDKIPNFYSTREKALEAIKKRADEQISKQGEDKCKD